MPRRLTGVLLALAAIAFAAPALAHASLVYQTGVAKSYIWVANDDGSGARRLIAGALPHLSPDGQTITFVANINADRPELRAMPVAGGPARTIMTSWRYGVFAWSANSRYIAAQAGPLNGAQRLVLIDLAAGTSRTLAKGFFSGASFSHASDQLVYSQVASDREIFPRANLEIAPVAGGPSHTLTNDGHSLYPVWGPTQIAYVRYTKPTGRHRHEDGPKYNLWLIAPDGSGRHQLTHDRVPFLLSGLTPTAWSADGTRLLAEFGGQDTAYAVTVNPASGRERVVGKASQGIVGTGLSRDGSTILGYTGGAAEDPNLENVITARYIGGAPKVVKRHAFSPDWNR
jgi:Tol biopolymer transport system component